MVTAVLVCHRVALPEATSALTTQFAALLLPTDVRTVQVEVREACRALCKIQVVALLEATGALVAQMLGRVEPTAA